jgi:L-ascorbate metabolism protein UlaG (beta-lactamase superfamily)
MSHWRLARFLLGGLLVATAALPQPPPGSFVSSPRRALVAPELLDAPDEWLDRSLRWVQHILETYPPAWPEHPVRRAALIRLDDILHIESAPDKPLVRQFYRARMESAVSQIERTPVSEGMRIWKLYNHGFLVRTPSVSLAFDIVPGVPGRGFLVEPSLLERLAQQADVLFISHVHGDHASSQVVRLFLERAKPVVAPEGLWADHPEFSGRLSRPRRSASLVHRLPVRQGHQVLEVVAYPGHQGERVINNVHLVRTPEGFTVVHTGDQSGSEAPGGDFDWIAHIGYQHAVDVLLPNCWTTDLPRLARGVNPRLIITGHENEMGHVVAHREDYTQTYNRLFGSPYPFLVMGWGESYHYRR